MPHTTYIIYSESLSKHYTGSTSVILEERLKKHNSNHSGYTGKSDDWKVVYSAEFESVQESRTLERKIKKRGASRFLENLKS